MTKGIPDQAIINDFLGTVDVCWKQGFTFLFRNVNDTFRGFSKDIKSVCCFEGNNALFGLGSRLKLIQTNGKVREEIDIGENVLDLASNR